MTWGVGVWKFPWGNHDFWICLDSNSDIMSVLEIVKSGANLVSDRKVVFSQNLGCALADFYGHYSLQDLHVPNFKIRHIAMDLLRHSKQLLCYFLLHAISSVYYLQLIYPIYPISHYICINCAKLSQHSCIILTPKPHQFHSHITCKHVYKIATK